MTIALLILGIFMAADTSMTLWAVSHGYREINPLMRGLVSSPVAAWSVTGVSLIGIAAIALYYKPRLPWVSWLILGLAFVGAGYAVVHNIGVLSRGR